MDENSPLLPTTVPEEATFDEVSPQLDGSYSPMSAFLIFFFPALGGLLFGSLFNHTVYSLFSHYICILEMQVTISDPQVRFLHKSSRKVTLESVGMRTFQAIVFCKAQ